MSQDFSGQNLRGRNFKGQDLRNANFSHADIRGANFSNATLRGADFSKAKAGLQIHWTITVAIISLLLSVSSGLVASINGVWTAFLFTPVTISIYTAFPGSILIILLAVFFALTVRKGLAVGAAVWSAILVVILTVAAVGAGALPVTVVVAASMAALVASVGTGALAVTLAAIVAPGGLLVLAVSLPVILGVIVAAAVASAVASAVSLPVILAAAIAGTVASLGAYVGYRAFIREEKFALVRKLAIFFSTTGGTNFQMADLTDANFTQAILKNTDFTNANLIRVRFYKAQNIDFAKFNNTNLTNPFVRDLLISGNGRNRSYIRTNLRGANLIGYDLSFANFKEADISEATLQGANLEGANLTLSQAVCTDFTGAQMTGACLEAWHITTNTKIGNVDCRFIYLLEYPKPGTDDRERRPSSGEFKPGEFTKLFEQVLNTVDLIFEKGIDWKAFVSAFKKVQVENEGIDLSIQSIENRGDGVVVIRVNIPPDTNKQKLHSEFAQNYIQNLKVLEEKYKAELATKEKEIGAYRQQTAYLRELVEELAKSPIVIYTNHKAEQE